MQFLSGLFGAGGPPKPTSLLAGQGSDPRLESLLRNNRGLHRLFPDQPERLLLLGAALFDRREHDNARVVLDRAVELGAPPWKVALIRAKRALLDEQPAAGLRFLEPFLDEPAHSELLLIAGTCAWEARQMHEAARYYEAGVAMAPRDVDLLGSLCGAYGMTGQYEKSREIAKRTLLLDPRHASALQNLGIAARELGLLEEQDDAYLRLCDYYADNERFRCLRAFALLMNEDFTAGWPLHENRDFRFREQKFRESTLQRPRWKGESLEGKTLLIVCEQGSGDNFMVARWFPEIKRRGARVVLECAPYLMAILARVPGVDQVIQLENAREPDLHYDLWVGSMSLPWIFNATRENIYAPPRYLEPGASTTSYWRDLVREVRGLKVGLAWAGNPGHASDISRSMKFADIDRLFDIPGITFFNLQVPARDLQERANLVNHTDELVTFDDTAGLIDQMDLVISVDTSIAHLAAALGRPTWVVTSFRPEWRWGRDDLKVMWYPTARVYRCDAPLNWRSAIDKVARDLKALAGLPAPAPAPAVSTPTGGAAHVV